MTAHIDKQFQFIFIQKMYQLLDLDKEKETYLLYLLSPNLYKVFLGSLAEFHRQFLSFLELKF